MPYYLEEINHAVRSDPNGFIETGDELYDAKISRAADMIAEHLSVSPIVLLSGPSGSGKTTTAMKIEQRLTERGIRTHSVPLDNYFKTLDRETTPRTPEGEPDLESPLCLDMELLNEHFTMLERGERIYVPKYEFSRHMRILEPSKSLRLGKDEVAIFEGIHALNDAITEKHPEAFKLYISARSNVLSGDRVVFKGVWMRLMRRTVRDKLFRGADPGYTLRLWANVRRGEKNYISPFKDKANLMLDSSLPYEVSVLRPFAEELFAAVSEGTERFAELRSIVPALELFEPLDAELLPPESLLREFIGGGSYSY